MNIRFLERKMGFEVFNYECQEQISLFDFINRQVTCKIDKTFQCNHANAKQVAISCGTNCKYDCCLSCKELCGARCNPSAHMDKPKFLRKTCAATLKECDCHCGTDSNTDKCCQNCTEECENRCNYSLDQPKVFDKNKAGTKESWVYNKNCTNMTVMIENALLRGTGFVNGKARVIALYQNDMERKERSKLIKNEYGLGGAGWPLKGYGMHGYDSFQSQGLKIQYRDATGEHEETITWGKVEQVIEKLVKSGRYKEE